MMKRVIAWTSMMHLPAMLQRELLGMMRDSHRIRVSPVLLSKDLLRAERPRTLTNSGPLGKSLRRHILSAGLLFSSP